MKTELSGNINNYGLVAGQGDRVYFNSGLSNYGKLYRKY